MAASKKDYVAIAAIIRQEMRVAETEAARGPVRVIAYALARHFAGDNPRFDRTRFLEACGVIQLCAWFALCSNIATTTRPHPVLGMVPICQRCTDKIARIEAAGS